jgi:CxxC motif-containing protein (DUF1111 family)
MSLRICRLGSVVVFALIAGSARAQSDAPDFGEPLAGLNERELARFEAGRAAFLERRTPEEGLGPVFNDRSCGACHNSPALGGGSPRLAIRFGASRGSEFEPLEALGGSLLQERGIGAANGCRFRAEFVPEQADVVAGRRTTPLFGLGLVDALADETLRALAAEQRARTPELAGTVSEVSDLATGGRAVGRFGWKAQNPNLFQFSGDAYVNELGITSPQFPDEICPQGDCSLLRCNPAPGLNDPNAESVARFADYMLLLAPPPRAEISAQVQRGEAQFEALGCGGCHVSALQTGEHEVAALSRVTFHPYSDFLLHDMGRLGDGIEQAAAGPRMMRTAPLWGLRRSDSLLHDGSASTPSEAILAHDGQAAASREAFELLTRAERRSLLEFLDSL